jgi:hypothetical protein
MPFLGGVVGEDRREVFRLYEGKMKIRKSPGDATRDRNLASGFIDCRSYG